MNALLLSLCLSVPAPALYTPVNPSLTAAKQERCFDDLSCPPGDACLNGECVFGGRCGSDVDCGPGRRCESGACH